MATADTAVTRTHEHGPMPAFFAAASMASRSCVVSRTRNTAVRRGLAGFSGCTGGTPCQTGGGPFFIFWTTATAGYLPMPTSDYLSMPVQTLGVGGL